MGKKKEMSKLRTDVMTGSLVGAGEDASFEILQKLTSLPKQDHKDYPSIGIYRWFPINRILQYEDLEHLAPVHKNSSVDILIKYHQDDYFPKQSMVAVRVEGKKGSLKMLRQGTQARLLSKYCLVVDIHKGECEELFKDVINEKSIKELKDSFKTARVEMNWKE
jgi:hypothetical protein